jgi:3-oxoacyl-[acyl-carrier protein] reductase
VNCLGGVEVLSSQSPEKVPESVWQDTYNRNALASIRYTLLSIPYMRKLKWGRVVTIASKQGREGGGKPWYAMAKSAEIALMKTMALNFDFARDGITFNSIAPGAILTEEGSWAEYLLQEPDKLKARLLSEFPLGRLGLPEEVANVVVFACSEKASLMSGACIPVDGGESKAF